MITRTHLIIEKFTPKVLSRMLSSSTSPSSSSSSALIQISSKSAELHDGKRKKSRGMKKNDAEKNSTPPQSVNSFEICVLFEDEHIIAINKPANMLSVPASITTISDFSEEEEKEVVSAAVSNSNNHNDSSRESSSSNNNNDDNNNDGNVNTGGGIKQKRRFEEWSDAIRNASNYTSNASVKEYLGGFANINNIPRQEIAFKRYVERNFRELRVGKDAHAQAENIKNDMWEAVTKSDIDLHRTSLNEVPMELRSAFEIVRNHRGVIGNSSLLWKVHRLDYDTSGVLLFAKSSVAAGELCRQFREKQVRKLYLAEVMGTPNNRVLSINNPLAPHPDDTMKPRQVISSDGKEALTYMKLLEQKGEKLYKHSHDGGDDNDDSNNNNNNNNDNHNYNDDDDDDGDDDDDDDGGDRDNDFDLREDTHFCFKANSVLETDRSFVDATEQDESKSIHDHSHSCTPLRTSLVMLEPITGRSHQLRVHMQHVGCPILGDTLYAPPEAANARSRLCLHAHKIRFKHPVNGENMELTANLVPAPSLALDYKAWINGLR